MELIRGLPRINYENCVGCGACVRVCPREIIEQVPFKVERMLVVACANHDAGKAVREVCRVGCVGCGACARQEPELFSIQNNLASLDYKHYTGVEDFGKVIDKCPMESLVMLGKPSLAHLKQLADVPPRKDSVRRPAAAESSPRELDWRG